MDKGFIYLLVDWGSNPEKYKIGITKNKVEDRIKSLQTGSSGEIVLLRKYESNFYKKIERFLHRKYAKYYCGGGKEWFELPNEEAINFTQECKNAESIFGSLKENPFF
jgi:hypothetical protein